MPRIAVAVAVVALVAFSIGFNTTRYTVVWDMVGGPSHIAQSDCATQPADSPQPTATTPSEPPAQLAMAPRRPAAAPPTPEPTPETTEHVEAPAEPAPKNAPGAVADDLPAEVADGEPEDEDDASADEVTRVVEAPSASEPPSDVDEGADESIQEGVAKEPGMSVAPAAIAEEQPCPADAGSPESPLPAELAAAAPDLPDRFDLGQEVRRLPPVNQMAPAWAD